MVRHNSSTIRLNYSFSTNEAQIPYMTNYRQELLFVLAPKKDYKPEIDSTANSKALRNNAKTTIGWDRQEFSLIKSVGLRLDSTYLVILRIYGKMIGSINGTGETKTFARMDCVQQFGKQKFLSTKSWPCVSGEIIQASHVCDTEPQCMDASDESQLLCEGKRTPFVDNLTHFLMSIVLIGFASYLFKHCLSLLPSIRLNEDRITDDSDLTEEIKEGFVAVRIACTDLKTVNDKKKQ